MREKELRFALICYGGISLAVYMHGITKEIWRLTAASRAWHDGSDIGGSCRIYRDLLAAIEARSGVRLRVLADIVAGASAGGINGVFLARALATGQSLDPLTDLWLEDADVDYLLDPDARPISAATKFWAVPIAGWAMKRRGNVIDRTVGGTAQDEVRAKLSRFVRARWFEPPFGGETFCNLLFDAFDAMDSGPHGPVLVPEGQPVDLFVSVTDFAGHSMPLSLHSPPRVSEQEHRLILRFRQDGRAGRTLDDVPALAVAARATASFPGAFPPFTLREIDRVLDKRGIAWPGRADFIRVQLPAGDEAADPADRVLIDGSVLANAPFRPAIAALKQRPARREIDRRFVYIDPKPDYRSISFGRHGEPVEGEAAPLPGFLTTILGALSEIPREQPIRDNVEAIEAMSRRIRRMQHIVDAMKVEVEEQVAALFGTTFFLDTPTPARLDRWRAKAQSEAASRAGFAYPPYGHLKLSTIVEELAALIDRLAPAEGAIHRAQRRMLLWDEVAARGLDRISGKKGAGASRDAIAFFRAHDLTFRIRRLRFLARELDAVEATRTGRDPACEAMRDAIYAALGLYVEREGDSWLGDLDIAADAGMGAWLDAIGNRRDLPAVDREGDERLAKGLAGLPKDDRRQLLLAYLGYPFYDIATLPLLQGEGFDEFDPIKIDRISPSDATAIRSGGAAAMLKGIEFNSFGAFFSRAYRENDYLWGRLHGADRLVDIVASSVTGDAALTSAERAAIKRRAFHAILDEEEGRLPAVAGLIAELRGEIDAGME